MRYLAGNRKQAVLEAARRRAITADLDALKAEITAAWHAQLPDEFDEDAQEAEAAHAAKLVANAVRCVQVAKVDPAALLEARRTFLSNHIIPEIESKHADAEACVLLASTTEEKKAAQVTVHHWAIAHAVAMQRLATLENGGKANASQSRQSSQPRRRK